MLDYIRIRVCMYMCVYAYVCNSIVILYYVSEYIICMRIVKAGMVLH